MINSKNDYQGTSIYGKVGATFPELEDQYPEVSTDKVQLLLFTESAASCLGKERMIPELFEAH